MICEDDVVTWLYEEMAKRMTEPINMGTMEILIDQVSMECRRRALERVVQEAADKEPLACPHCQRPLNIEERNRARGVNSMFGPMRFTRSYGFCSTCDEYVYSADAALGLQTRATASPRVQEICALTTLRAPSGQAQKDLRRMTGIEIDPSTIHREARRQGDRALGLRDTDVALSKTPDGVNELASRATPPKEPFTLVIEIDAWNIRERDNWGLTKKLLDVGKGTERWHWVYTGTIFRLDQRSTTASGRPVIAERGYVATRSGLDGFKGQLYAEALQRGLLQAEKVLILADGAIWIWNIAKDRFDGATQRVDLYHVKEHLWNLANELFGRGTDKAKQWVNPFLNWLQRRKAGVLDVINGLEELHETLTDITQDQQEAIKRQIGYFTEHRDRMDYKDGKALGQPIGSGAIESTCNQYQRRFKLPGQFWTLEGDEAFLTLATLHHNGRWHRLFPHDNTSDQY